MHRRRNNLLMAPASLQVAAGAYVNRDRDSALKRMIYFAASRYTPEQEELMSSPSVESASGMRISASMLRKISLTSVSIMRCLRRSWCILAAICHMIKTRALSVAVGYVDSTNTFANKLQGLPADR